jgi:hypothetical protein
VEGGVKISFNFEGTAAVLHTTNAFGANFDLLHIANYSPGEVSRLRVIYPIPDKSLGDFSVNSEGDLIALSPPQNDFISIMRLTHGLEIYRIDPRQFQMTPFNAMSFVPGGEGPLMTSHSGNYSVFWDVNRLSDTDNSLNSAVSWDGKHHCIAPNGETILLHRITDRGLSPLVLHFDHNSNVITTPIKPQLFDRAHDASSPMAISNDGKSIVIGRYAYSVDTKIKTKKLSIPVKSKVLQCAISPHSTIAIGVLVPNGECRVRTHTKRHGGHDWTPSNPVKNIWGLAFCDEKKFLAVGVQVRSNGIDKFTIHIVNTGDEMGPLTKTRTVSEWDSLKPLKLAVGNGGKLIVLARASNDAQKLSSMYSVIIFNITTVSGGVEEPTILQFVCSPLTAPAMSSEGQIFYLGAERDEGWIMRADVETKTVDRRGMADERVAWCPVSWRSIGGFCLLCGSNGDTATVICLNEVLGVAALRVRL